MPIIILLVVALLPAGLLWAYIWKKDPQKEPTPQLIRAGLYGAGICLPVALFELGVQAVLFEENSTPTKKSSPKSRKTKKHPYHGTPLNLHKYIQEEGDDSCID